MNIFREDDHPRGRDGRFERVYETTTGAALPPNVQVDPDGVFDKPIGVTHSYPTLVRGDSVLDVMKVARAVIPATTIPARHAKDFVLHNSEKSAAYEYRPRAIRYEWANGRTWERQLGTVFTREKLYVKSVPFRFVGVDMATHQRVFREEKPNAN